VALRTDDVAWAETIDGRLEFAALDGSGTSFVDELEGYTFTRPAEEDCAAIAAPPAVATVPAGPGGATPFGTSATADEGGEPGTASDAEVELVEAASPVATPRASAPMLAAALALVGAVAGLGAVLSRSLRTGRRPTSSG
jgi:hypothetical protein